MNAPIGLPGVAGMLVLLGGIGVIGYVDPLLAAGMVAILVGIALVLADFLRRTLASLGLAGML